MYAFFLARGLSCILVSAIVLSFSVRIISAEEHSPKQTSTLWNPRVCSGFQIQTGDWGIDESRVHRKKRWLLCQDDEAYFGVAKVWMDNNQSVQGNCCPLPAKDIFTGKHLIVRDICPEGYAATGVLWAPPSHPKEDQEKPNRIRCSKINDSLYRLAAAKPGIQWGLSSSGAFPWHERKRIRLDQIPLGIRYGIARETRQTFLNSGCVAERIGGLFVGVDGELCKATYWRQLYRREVEGDIPLKMFPDCKKITKLLSPNPVCVE